MSLSTRKNTYPENCRVFVGNLDNLSTDKDEMAQIFAPYGELAEEVHIHKYVHHSQLKFNRGFAFVQYKTPEAAQAAIKAENGRQIGNKKVDLGLAKGGKNKEKRKSPPRDSGFKRERPSNFYPEERIYKKPIPDYPQKPSGLEPIGVIPLLVIHTALRNYANHIQSNFASAGIQIEVRFVNRLVFQESIDESVARNDRYTMYINRKNEENGTISFRACKPDGVSPGIADVSVNDAINFVLKNERDYAQLYSSAMNRFSQPNSYSQYQKPLYDYPPPTNDFYYQPQQFQKQPIFSNDQYLNQPLINDPNQDFYYPQSQPQQQQQQQPELQNLLLNLLTTLKEPDTKSNQKSEKNNGEISSDVLGLLNSLSSLPKE